MIELLIVVAVIGILAAIAIPSFSTYRIKAYNSSALADIRSLKMNLESYYQENGRYP
ncbi:type IV pilin protein [Geomonas oryzae]|uniref:type IV pilin protein n=1 Tax=Geomonas oryzae TaxID=2364273 RepID=UPI002482DF47|nr:pilus assembly protein [Geomonas oryzae]